MVSLRRGSAECTGDLVEDAGAEGGGMLSFKDDVEKAKLLRSASFGDS